MCKPMHIENLEALRIKLGIKERPKVRERTKEEQHTGATTTVPKKVGELVAWLDNSSLKVIDSLQRGENPFINSTKKFLRVAAHILLKRPVSQQLLTKAYMSAFNWSDEYANAHARIAIQAFIHIGAVDEIDGNVSLRRPA